MSTVLLVLMYGQSRVFMAMSRDKLIPQIFSKIHPKFHTPHINATIVSIGVALTSGLTPIHTLGHMTSLGTLFAFVVVAAAVMILRIKRPDLERGFRCPAVFVVAPLAIITCGYLIISLFMETGIPFLIWIALGLVVYFGYSYKRSELNNLKTKEISSSKL